MIAAAPVRVVVKNQPRGLVGLSDVNPDSQKPRHFAVLGRGVLLVLLVALFWGGVGAILAEFSQRP
ncbi:MAG: hypothetical protein ABUL42_01545 [Terricaulis silvestris]